MFAFAAPFVDNPQFLLKAPAGTNLTILLQDTLEASREQEKVRTTCLEWT